VDYNFAAGCARKCMHTCSESDFFNELKLFRKAIEFQFILDYTEGRMACWVMSLYPFLWSVRLWWDTSV